MIALGFLVARNAGSVAMRNEVALPTDHALGRWRGAWGSKFHLVVDAHAIPLAAAVSAGQSHESTKFIELMEKVRPPRWTSLAAAGRGR